MSYDECKNKQLHNFFFRTLTDSDQINSLSFHPSGKHSQLMTIDIYAFDLQVQLSSELGFELEKFIISKYENIQLRNKECLPSLLACFR